MLPRSGVGDFAYAAAARFPWVRLWTVWNEPNTRTFSVPVSPRATSARCSTRPTRAARASSANLVAGGVTSPRKTATGMAPLDYMRGMRAAHARLDAYAQNPYASAAGDARRGLVLVVLHDGDALDDPPRGDAELRLEAALADRVRLPDEPARTGSSASRSRSRRPTSARRRSRCGGSAASTMLIQFLVRDEPAVGGWQSGLFTASGKPKLSYHAFALPLAQASRSGSRAILWGRCGLDPARALPAPARCRRPWRTVGGTATTARVGAVPA